MPEKKVRKILKVGREEASNLSSFVERPVPTEREVVNFERVVRHEARDQEIESNLSEFYSGQDGDPVDVKKMKVKKRAPFFVRLLRRLLLLALLGLAAYFAYNYWFGGNNDVSALDFKIIAPETILAGEEFAYKVEYRNPTKYVLSDLRLEIQYPENFIFSAASENPVSGNYGWDLADLAPHESKILEIKGRIIARPDSINLISGRLSYLPGNFSSQFTKEASASTLMTGPGWRLDLVYSKTAFLNQDNEMTLILSEIGENYLGNFNLAFSLPAEVSAEVVLGEDGETGRTGGEGAGDNEAGAEVKGDEEGVANDNSELEDNDAEPKNNDFEFENPASEEFAVSKSTGTSWQVSGLKMGTGRQEIPLSYRVGQRLDDLEIKVRLEKRLADGQSYVFWEKSFKPELVDSDLNLTLILNGSKSDGAVNFGQSLNYSLSYANRGITTFNDVVILAAVKGDFLDWYSLQNSRGGQVGNQSIIWTKNEIPALTEIKPGQEGTIDFSLALAPFKDGDYTKDLKISAYGQYSVNNNPVKGDDNKSNTITSQINSDLLLNERIRYFNDNNLPVGAGPLPPQVGQKTSFRVYWTVENNLHELAEARAVFDLPDYVIWENGETNVGSIYYDDASRQIIWEIGRLPLSVYRADAEFDISITPLESDRNKILVLSSGSTVSATDIETKDVIIKKTSAKTTKLEDDDIAGLNNSGVVQ
jgi:hypothetical protein